MVNDHKMSDKQKYLQYCDEYPEDDDIRPGCGWWDNNKLPLGQMFKYDENNECPECGMILPKKRRRVSSRARVRDQLDNRYLP